MKIVESVLLSLFMRDYEKCNIFHAPNTDLIGDPEGPEKYNNTEMVFLLNLDIQMY